MVLSLDSASNLEDMQRLEAQGSKVVLTRDRGVGTVSGHMRASGVTEVRFLDLGGVYLRVTPLAVRLFHVVFCSSVLFYKKKKRGREKKTKQPKA